MWVFLLVCAYSVAPRVGAWIETHLTPSVCIATESHPVWVRGLKHLLRVAQCVKQMSHPVWVRGLKQILSIMKYNHLESHPVWVRGLKLCI